MKNRSRALWLALAFLTACGPDAPTSPAEAPALASSRQAPAAAGSHAALATSAGGIAFHARDVQRSVLLKRLAALARFQLMGVPSDDRLLSIDSEGAPVEQLLGELLIGEPYTLRYAIDDETGAHRLERVTLGTLENDLARIRREDRLARQQRAKENRAATRGERRTRDRDVSPEEREERLTRRAREREEREREIETALAADDAKTRARGVGRLDPEEDGVLPQLLEFSGDPDPEVRAAAVSRLAMSDSRAANDALFQALGDRDPQVVMGALDGLALRHDETTIPLIRPLLDHPDQNVRMLAAETIEFLE